MRQSLMQSFQAIYVLDLHGNSLKRETCPDGSPDKNVFDIRQGVSVVFLIKRVCENAQDTEIRHSECYGTRESKYSWLNSHCFENTDWCKVSPIPPFYVFVPRDNTLNEKYNKFSYTPELFLEKVAGLYTARDHLTIHRSEDSTWNTVLAFSKMDSELARECYNLGMDSQDWKVQLAQEDLNNSGPNRELVVPVLYRPFDVRYTYYTGKSRGFICRPRSRIMRHMLSGKNIAMCIGRQGQVVGDNEWNLVYCSQTIEDYNLYYRGGNVNLPLYTYTIDDVYNLFSQNGKTERNSNLNPKLITTLEKVYGQTPTPEAVFNYIYAILNSPSYRLKYAEFLSIDFPRIPFTADQDLFYSIATCGEQLVKLHLLNPSSLDPPTCRFKGDGDSKIARSTDDGLRYKPDEQRIYINNTQYFSPIPTEIYEHRIGGYQICEKWLKDRKDCKLELHDIRTFCRIVTALEKTQSIQREIDKVYDKIEGKTVHPKL